MQYSLKIDGKPVTIFRIEKHPSVSSLMSVFVGAEGAKRPSSQHDIPKRAGKFRTNGHSYELSEDRPRCSECGQSLEA